MAKKDNQKNKSGPSKAKTRSRKTPKQRYKERLLKKGLSKDVLEKMTQKQMRLKIKELKEKGEDVPDLRESNTSPKALGKDMGIREVLKEDLNEVVEITTLNKETQQHTKEKTTKLKALLKMLYNQAISKRDVRAAKEYLDRTLGKAIQSVELDTPIKTDEQRPPTKAELAAAKAYEEALAEEEDE